jgi:hypothetical protein
MKLCCNKKSRRHSRKNSRKHSRKRSKKHSRKHSRKRSRKHSKKMSRKRSRKHSKKISRKRSRKHSKKHSKKMSRKPIKLRFNEKVCPESERLNTEYMICLGKNPKNQNICNQYTTLINQARINCKNPNTYNKAKIIKYLIRLRNDKPDLSTKIDNLIDEFKNLNIDENNLELNKRSFTEITNKLCIFMKENKLLDNKNIKEAYKLAKHRCVNKLKCDGIKDCNPTFIKTIFQKL